MSELEKKYNEKLNQKLSAARTRLIMERPFLGALTLRLPLVEGDAAWCKTTATDAKKIYFNAKYVELINPKQLQFMLAHNALHCALSHFHRKQSRDQHRWDVACDFAVNAMLIQEGMSPPSDALYIDRYIGMTAEEIYPLIDENTDKEPIDQHVYDDSDTDTDNTPDSSGGQGENQTKESGGGNGSGNNNKPELDEQGSHGNDKQIKIPESLSHAEREMLSTTWQQSLAGAAQQAMQAGKMSKSMLALVDHLLQPNVPWRNLLAHYLSATARADYNFMRPSRRSAGEMGNDAIYPSLHSKQMDVVIVIDSSGSIGEVESQEFINEISALKSQVNASVTLIVCDEKIEDTPVRFEPWEPINDCTDLVKAGRGTSFVPPFEWVEAEGTRPDLLIYFTDAQGEFPSEPPFPVLWLVKGKTPVPWGQRVQLN